MGSSPGMGNSSSRHEHERESSHDSWSAPRDSARETKRDASTPGRRDLDQDRIRRGQGGENAPRIDSKIDSTIDSKIAGPHERDAATGSTISPANGSRRQIGRDSDDRPDAAGRRQGQCDKEPCAKPAPELLQSDWRLGRCQGGPCEPCPEGTSPNRYGNCVANARPPAVPAAAICPDGMRWSGASCESLYATGRQLQAGASQCLYYFSESNRLSSNVRSARRHESDECQKNSGSAECSFAHMDALTAESACSILVAEAPAECKSQVSSCL